MDHRQNGQPIGDEDEQQYEIPVDEIIIEYDDDDDVLDDVDENDGYQENHYPEINNFYPPIPIPYNNNNNNISNYHKSPTLIGENGVSIEMNTPPQQPQTNDNKNIEIEDIGGADLKKADGSPSEEILSEEEVLSSDGEGGVRMKKRKVVRRKRKQPVSADGSEIPSVPFMSLFRFASKGDWLLMFFGSLAAICNGAAMPMVSIIYGEVIDAFNPDHFNNDPNYGIEKEVTRISMYFLIVGAAVFVCSYLETALWMIAGERQTNKARKEYLSSILRQEIGWFDTNKANELASRINSDTILYQEAIGEKVGHFLHNIATFIAGFAIGFTKGWQLTLVITSISPLLAFGGGFMAKMMTEMTRQAQEAYARAGGIAEESMGAIRTVVTFSGEGKSTEKYAHNLKDALRVGYKRSVFAGFGLGFVQLVILGTYALAFWYGSTLVSKKTINDLTKQPWTGGDVVAVFFAVIIGATAIGQASPNLGAFAQGRGAAFKIFQVIDRVSKANPFSSRGISPTQLSGDIQFKNVVFHYPSRPDVPIFKGFNLTIKPGQTVGLVGDSGGGKSTCISLLERFYDPVGGQILIDGEDIKRFNVSALRQKIGLVSQEPVLFATTIEENIRYGKLDATLEEIKEAARLANAHSFISQLPEGYQTLVGEKGVMMSGGQKQRIAIARAIIKNPNVLLLDEATSALDSEAERVVQEAIDELMKGRTTIVIAHRLSTIRNADQIVFVKGGVVVEKGTHDELMALEGHYHRLVEKQNQQQINNILETGRSRRSSTFSDVNPLIDSFRPSTRSTRTRSSLSQKSKKVVKKKKVKDVPMSRVIAYSKPETWLFIFGILSAVGTGGVYPAFSIVFTEMLTIFQHPDSDYVKKNANFVAIMFMVLAVGAGVSNFFQTFLFSVIGEKLTFRLRRDSFRAIMRQDVGWFDQPDNTSGKLAAHLASDASLVQGMTSQRLGILIQNIMTVLGSLVIAFISGWKLTLVIIACFPLVVFTSKIHMKMLHGFSDASTDGTSGASQVASEAITGIRTVASFTSENQVLKLYKQQLRSTTANGTKRGHISGIAFGVSQMILFCVYCLAFWYGGKLVDNNEWPASQEAIDKNCSPATIGTTWKDRETCENAQNIILGFSEMIRVFFAIVMSAIGVGQASGLAPDMAKAKVATNHIFKLLDTKTNCDATSEDGQKIDIVVGDIEFKNLYFAYPTRPNNNVYRGFSLVVEAGTTVAFVGDSGGGKSTAISLLERFYDPSTGEIFIDGHNIKNLNVKHLRGLFGLVGQEPTLFSGTIAENIAYGVDDATREQIENAAKLANAHTFISALPDGYDTPLGDKFTQLSGGQKQRIAIARAVIRNPKILLLDEATSALDSESERVVQEALENAMKGRTTLVIAHRLSTIQSADCICFVKAGQIVEKGTHEELMEDPNGLYAQLIQRQSMK